MSRDLTVSGTMLLDLCGLPWREFKVIGCRWDADSDSLILETDPPAPDAPPGPGFYGKGISEDFQELRRLLLEKPFGESANDDFNNLVDEP